MKIVGILGASCVAYTVLLSSQGGAVASTIEGDKAPKTAVSVGSGQAWSTDLKFGRYEAAIKQLDSALGTGKLEAEQRAVALINRGLAHQQLKQYKKAVADYSAALKEDALATKTRAVVVYNRGIAHQKLKRQALAIEDFTNALYLDVEFAHAYYGRGRLMQEVGRHEFALADFRMAMKYHHPSPHLPFYGQALSYQSTQQKAKARKAISRALLIKPNFKPALDKYAELTGQPYNARRMVLPASKISPIIAKRGSSSSTLNRPRTAQAKALAGSQKLPQAVAPTEEMLVSAGTAEKFVEVDPIVTGSISKTAQTGEQPVETKLPFRYPGMVGATKPVPAMTPQVQLTDLRPEAEKNSPQLNSQNGGSDLTNQVVLSEQDTETAADNSARTRVAYLGNSAAPLGSNTEVEAADSGKTSATAQESLPDAEQPEEELRGWFIQLNAQRSQEAAKEVWQKYKAKHRRALRGTNVVYQRADLGDKGIYWRVRLGSYKGRSAAARKCRRLKRSGLRCFVVKAG